MKAEGDGRPSDGGPLAAGPRLDRTSINSLLLWDRFLGLDVISPERETRLDWGGLFEGCDEGGGTIEGGDRDWEPSPSGPFEERMGSNLLNEKVLLG
jgi:hypothetical protein